MPNTLRPLPLAARLSVTAWLATASPAFGQGATTPFVTYEAEEGTLSGGATVRTLAAPLTTWSDTPEAEASGRAFVQLQNTGDSLTLPNHTGGNVTFIDFRYSIPDAPAGGGITSTLNLYVDGVFRQSLYVTSKQTWLYASQTGNAWDGMSQNPDAGSPHIFFDEGHAFISGAPVAPGSKITFQKDSANIATFYWIDCVDLEDPPPPLTQPSGSISIADSGAVPTTLTDPIPDDAVDSTAAIQSAINAASGQGMSVWIPQGRFIVNGVLSASGITIEGAGMWYSAAYRNPSLPVTTNDFATWNVSSGTMRNFLIDSNSQSRTSSDGDLGGINLGGTSWVVENMWVQHTSSGVWGAGTGGVAQNNRMLSTWGDGININNGNHGGTGNNLTVRNNYVRGVGDDGVTINSDVTSAQMQNPTLEDNTTVSVYWAHGLGVYGGNNDLVQGNLLCDPANFPGMIVGIFNGAPLQSAIVQGNVIVRGGGDCYNENLAAIEIGASAVTVGDVQFLDNVIIDSMQKALEVTGATSMTFSNNVIDGLWVNGASPSSVVSAIDIPANVTGSATFTSNTLQDLLAGQVAWVNASSSGFPTSGVGNVGFDPTVAGPTYWKGSSDAGAARRTASCTTPVALVLGDAGSPPAASDGGDEGGGASPESGTGTSQDGGFAGAPDEASTADSGPDAGAAKASSTAGCGCAIPGLGSAGGWPGVLALLASSLGIVLRRGRARERRVVLLLVAVSACSTGLHPSAVFDGGVEGPDATVVDAEVGDAAFDASSADSTSPVRDGGGPITIPTSYPTGPGPASVQLGDGGSLVYAPDPNGDTVPDFSSAGYMGGGVALPVFPVVTTLAAISGEVDATAPTARSISPSTCAPLGQLAGATHSSSTGASPARAPDVAATAIARAATVVGVGRMDVAYMAEATWSRPALFLRMRLPPATQES